MLNVLVLKFMWLTSCFILMPRSDTVRLSEKNYYAVEKVQASKVQAFTGRVRFKCAGHMFKTLTIYYYVL